MTTGALPDNDRPPLLEFDGPETSAWDLRRATRDAEAIARNSSYLLQRRTLEAENAALAAMSQGIYGDPNAWMFKGTPEAIAALQGRGMIGPGLQRQASLDAMFADAARIRGQMPGEVANFPTSYAEMKGNAEATANRELEAEKEDLDNAIGNRSRATLVGGAAAMVGAMEAYLGDIKTLPLTAFAVLMPEVDLARTVLIEGTLAAAQSAVDLPSRNYVADRLGYERPDPLRQILTDVASGAVLPIAGRAGLATLKATGRGIVAVTGKGIERIDNWELLRAARRDGATSAERGAGLVLGRAEATADTAPPGVNPMDHADAVDRAGSALDGDSALAPPAAPVLPPVGPDAPPGWERIRNGIFEGESGADWDALFGFSNREGGPFADVKLTEMTVDEAIAFANPQGEYGQWVARTRRDAPGVVATPMGAYQIVGDTLKAAAKGLGLKGDELMTPELQDRLAQYIYRPEGLNQGTGAWVGYRGERDSFTPTAGGRYRGAPGPAGLDVSDPDAFWAFLRSGDPMDLTRPAGRVEDATQIGSRFFGRGLGEAAGDTAEGAFARGARRGETAGFAPPEPARLDPGEAAAAARRSAIDTEARAIDPEAFAQLDRAEARAASYRRWIEDLQAGQGQEVDGLLAGLHEARADIEAQIATTRTGGKGRMKQRLREIDRAIAEAEALPRRGETRDVAQVRDALAREGEATRDLAPRLGRARAEAERRIGERGDPALPARPAERAAARPEVAQGDPLAEAMARFLGLDEAPRPAARPAAPGRSQDRAAPPAAPKGDLPPVGEARLAPGRFDDPVEDLAEKARLARLSREISARMADPAAPDMDLVLPSDDGRGTNTVSLRAELASIKEDAEFLDQLAILCNLKGPAP